MPYSNSVTQDGESMGKRIDPSWTVVRSPENQEHDRCVDIFRRPDGSWGFEAFRRDPEDGGAWTPVSFHAFRRFGTQDEAEQGARTAVMWLGASDS